MTFKVVLEGSTVIASGPNDDGYEPVVGPGQVLEIWDTMPIPEAFRVNAVTTNADDMVGKYINPFAWIRIMQIYRKRAHLSRMHMRTLLLNMYDDLLVSASLLDLQLSLATYSADRDKLDLSDNTMTHLANQLHNNLVPIEEWIDKVYSHASDLIDDDTLTPDWGQFDEGADGGNDWKPAWTNTIDRFS